jgi:hypothetical protein
MVANRHRLQRCIEGQYILQQLHTGAIRGQGGPFGLQIEQLRGGPLRQERGQRTKTLGGMGLTGTVGETGAFYWHVAKYGAKHGVV